MPICHCTIQVTQPDRSHKDPDTTEGGHCGKLWRGEGEDGQVPMLLEKEIGVHERRWLAIGDY